MVVQLDYANRGGTVTVTPRNQDRFAIQVEAAIDACKAAVEAKLFKRQFDLLLKVLAEWLLGQKGVSSAFVTQRDGGLLFLVVRDSKSYDRAFEDSLSDLDVQLANDPNLALVPIDTIALPSASHEAASSFLRPGLTLAFNRSAAGR